MRLFFMCIFCLVISPVFSQSSFLRGDANNDGTRDQSDSVFILEYLYEGGDEPSCMDSADVDNSGEIDGTDATVLLYHVYYNDPATLPNPFNNCDFDPGPDLDGMGCESHICGVKFRRGDMNHNGVVNSDDYSALSSHLNNPVDLPCNEEADINDDGQINNNDLTFLGQYLFQSGPEPLFPFNNCDVDLEAYPADSIDCNSNNNCNP